MSPLPDQEADVVRQGASKNLWKSSFIYPLRAHPAKRFFALDCAISAQSGANPFCRLGGVGRDHFQPTQSPALRLWGSRETALFSLSKGGAGSLRRISELVDSAQLTQTAAFAPFRPVLRVRVLPAPPDVLSSAVIIVYSPFSSVDYIKCFLPMPERELLTLLSQRTSIILWGFCANGQVRRQK
jgi:hypothetical protein